MNLDIQGYAEFCSWTPTYWLIVSENVFDPLIYYSHLVPILLALPLASIIYWNNRHKIENQLFFLTVLLFSIWAFGDLILWANDEPGTIMFVWSVLIVLEPLIYLCSFCFAYQILQKTNIPTKLFAPLLLVIAPIVLFASTTLMLESFNLTNCWREVNEGPLVFYGYFVQLLIAAGILILTLVYLFRSKEDKRLKTLSTLTSLSILLFLGIFSFGNIAGSFFENWTIGQYGLFGMPVMVATIGFLISKYNAFKTNLFASQLLVTALAILTFSITFVQNLNLVRIISLITFVLVVILGTILVKSTKREIEQKKLAQQLATELAGTNAKLERLDKMKSEFVSIASHQLRSPLTSVRGYISMVLEGSYGEVPPKIKEVLEHVSDAARHMAFSIEDYLNVSRIEAGNMKYDLTDVDVSKMVSDIVTEMIPVAEKKGIPVVFKSQFTGPAISKLDVGKARQIIQNLIDNALKYTPDKGEIHVVVRNDVAAKKVFIDVVDQGIGLSEESRSTLFEKFERAKNASHINVTGTGLGLYIARTMARAMGGDITVTSEGEGKGSIFTITFPLNGIEAKWSTKS